MLKDFKTSILWFNKNLFWSSISSFDNSFSASEILLLIYFLSESFKLNTETDNQLNYALKLLNG